MVDIVQFPAQSEFQPGDMVEFWYRAHQHGPVIPHPENGTVGICSAKRTSPLVIHVEWDSQSNWGKAYENSKGFEIAKYHLKLISVDDNAVFIEGDDDDDCV